MGYVVRKYMVVEQQYLTDLTYRVNALLLDATSQDFPGCVWQPLGAVFTSVIGDRFQSYMQAMVLVHLTP